MKIFFEPVNLNHWNLFNNVKSIGHIEPFLATKQMECGDMVLLHVGAQDKRYESGIYAVGIVVKDPYILEKHPEDYCNNKNTVDIRIDYIDCSNPIISHKDSMKFINQYRTVHCIDEQYYNEILEIIGSITKSLDSSKNDNSNCSELLILKTEQDLKGTEIVEMSDFFGEYINQLSGEICSTASLVPANDIPVADIGILSNAIQSLETKLSEKAMFVLDFKHLPKTVKEKLKSGEYKLGNSRQVDGNLRPVIIDKDNVRVKDVTIKKVENGSVRPEITNSMVEQLQLRQIYLKLDSMERTQKYQLGLEKSNAIVRPFLDARDNIKLAQATRNIDDQHKYLEKAFDKLIESRNAAITDLEETFKQLCSEVTRPFLRNTDIIDDYTRYITSDLNVTNKAVGLQLQILDYQGKHDEANIIQESHKEFLYDFCCKPIPVGKNKISRGMIVHNNYPYGECNNNAWYELIKNVEEGSNKAILSTTYVILPEVDDENNDV